MIRILVTSLKGGAGVTTLVSGLCQAAAAEDLDVLCLDNDDQGLLKYSFGMVGLSDGGEMRNGNPRIRLSDARSAGAYLDTADVVVIDQPRQSATLSVDSYIEVDAVVLVVSASAASVALAPRIARFLGEGENRFLIINQEDARVPLKHSSASYLEAQFGERLIGRIRHDGAVDDAFASLEPLSRAAPHSAVWSDVRSAFSNLISHMNDLPVPAAGDR